MNKQNENKYSNISQKKNCNDSIIKIISKRSKNETLKNNSKIDNKTFSYKLYKNNSYIQSPKNKNDFSSQIGNLSLISNIYPDLIWNNYQSIYDYLISYINLMIVDLNKDNNKLCKYLKEIFFAIFSISQKTKNYYKTNNIHNIDKNNIINDNNTKTNNSTNIGEWNFITGEINNSSNNNIMMEDLYEKEKNDIGIDINKMDKDIDKNNNKKMDLTQRTNNIENEKNLQIFFLQEKIEKLNKKFKKKEKQFQIDKLNYLFRINEQNILIKQLEDKIKIHKFKSLSERTLNKLKCFPDYRNGQNNEVKIDEKNQDKENIIKNYFNKNKKERKNFFLSHPKINFDETSIGKNCRNMEDIINRNLIKFRNKGKLSKSNFKKFLSLSLNETKLHVEKIINIK